MIRFNQVDTSIIRIISWFIIINIIGVWFFLFLLPYYQEYRSLISQKEHIKQELDKKNIILKTIRDGEKLLERVKSDWTDLARDKASHLKLSSNGNLQVIDPWEVLVNVRNWRDHLQTSINRDFKNCKINVIKGPVLPFPSSDPDEMMEKYLNYPALPFPLGFFTVGPVVVEGEYQHVLDHLYAINDRKGYIVSLNNIQLERSDYKVRGTYSMDMVSYFNLNMEEK